MWKISSNRITVVKDVTNSFTTLYFVLLADDTYRVRISVDWSRTFGLDENTKSKYGTISLFDF